MKKFLTIVVVGCLGICIGLMLGHLRVDRGAKIPDVVRACFNRWFSGCEITYVTTPQIHIHTNSLDNFVMVYRISFRNLKNIPMSVEIFPDGRGLYESDEASY